MFLDLKICFQLNFPIKTLKITQKKLKKPNLWY